MRERKTDENRKIDEKVTMQVVIDAKLHRYVKMQAAKQSMTIRELVEAGINEVLE